MRAGFLGPAGTFSEEALLATAPPDTEPVPFATVDAVVRAVAGGEVARGLVPIESATEGSVDAVHESGTLVCVGVPATSPATFGGRTGAGPAAGT